MVWASQSREPHNFESMCSDCHADLENPGFFTKDPDILCLACHPERKERSHPSGVLPAKGLPPEFPLYEGKLVCISCHIAHKTYEKKDVKHKIFENNLYMLRGSQTGKEFCAQCHRENAPDSQADAHALAFKRAHNLNRDMSLKDVLHDDSSECLRCHKEVVRSHPIGIEYTQTYMKNPDLYYPPSSFDSSIRLINEKIGCQTCHDQYSEHPYLLVIENDDGRLCAQCHNL